jgi:HK97 gp10 family phage protein
MARNLSVGQLQDLLNSISPAIAAELDMAVAEQALRLAESQRAAVPIKSGKLKQSIKVEKGRKTFSYRVVAGGALTTVEARQGSGASYDYSRGVEFGTVAAPAKPFFFPTYRLLKSRIKSGIAKKVKPAIGKVVNLDSKG